MPGVAILLATATLGVDYGWEMTNDGQLEYIIQIEPQLLQLLKPGESITSEIDPRLAKARRFRIRVGNETLSRELPPAALTTSAVRPIDTADSQVRAVSDEPTAGDGFAEEPLSDAAASKDRWEAAIPPLIPDRYEDAGTAESSTPTSPSANGEAWSAASQERPEIPTTSEEAAESRGDGDPSSPSVEFTNDLRDGPPDNEIADPFESRAVGSGADVLLADPTEAEPDARPTFDLLDRPPADTLVGDAKTDTGQGMPPYDDESSQPEVAAGPGPPADWDTPFSRLGQRPEGDASHVPLTLDEDRFARSEGASGQSSVAADEAISVTEAERGAVAEEQPETVADNEIESVSPAEGDVFDPYAVDSASMSPADSVPRSPKSKSAAPRRWLPFVATLIALFASGGLNLFLGWIAWDTYNRYQDLLSDLQHARPHGIAS